MFYDSSSHKSWGWQVTSWLLFSATCSLIAQRLAWVCSPGGCRIQNTGRKKESPSAYMLFIFTVSYFLMSSLPKQVMWQSPALRSGEIESASSWEYLYSHNAKEHTEIERICGHYYNQPIACLPAINYSHSSHMQNIPTQDPRSLTLILTSSLMCGILGSALGPHKATWVGSLLI